MVGTVACGKGVTSLIVHGIFQDFYNSDLSYETVLHPFLVHDVMVVVSSLLAIF